MGNPVALLARAEDRETRGFISMITMRPSAGFTANWMLEPPVSTPISRITAIAASRMRWYSLSVSVWAGATVMESPVWIPMGSRFSMEQTITTLSRRSRMSSSSNSFQPITDSSTRTSEMGERSRPRATISSYSSSFQAMPPPEPPRVKAGRITQGRPIRSRTPRASSGERTNPERGRSRPIRSMACLNRSRSSALWIVSIEAPSISTPYRSRTPRSASATAVFSPVWPPRVGRRASGRSLSITFSTASGVTGST